MIDKKYENLMIEQLFRVIVINCTNYNETPHILLYYNTKGHNVPKLNGYISRFAVCGIINDIDVNIIILRRYKYSSKSNLLTSVKYAIIRKNAHKTWNTRRKTAAVIIVTTRDFTYTS